MDSKWVESYSLASSQPEALVSVLRWLGVIDRDGKSQGVWNELRTNREETLKRLMGESYAAVFDSVDVGEASRQDLEGAFINSYATGSTSRPVKCFLALCAHAGIDTKAPQRRSVAERAGTAPPERAKPVANQAAPRHSVAVKASKSTAADRAPGIAVTLNVEIPADWSDEQVGQRVEAVRRAIAA